jgi:hypothetical protein
VIARPTSSSGAHLSPIRRRRLRFPSLTRVRQSNVDAPVVSDDAANSRATRWRAQPLSRSKERAERNLPPPQKQGDAITMARKAVGLSRAIAAYMVAM